MDASLPETKVILDGDCPQRDGQGAAVGSINQLPVDYTKLEDYLEKSMFLLDDAEDLRCQICKEPVVPHAQQIVVCPQASCRGTFHLLCLSAKFLEAVGEPDSLVPTQGACPTCKQVVLWPVMMQELSLRNRAEKEASAILQRKEKRARKNSKNNTANVEMSSVESTRDGLSQRTQESVYTLAQQEDPQLDDNWYEGVDLESDSEHGGRHQSQSPPPLSRLEIVIEDSEWDDAELVE